MTTISFSPTAEQSPTSTVTQSPTAQAKRKPLPESRSVEPIELPKPAAAELPPDFLPPDDAEPADGGWNNVQPSPEPAIAAAAANSDVDVGTEANSSKGVSEFRELFTVVLLDPKSETNAREVVYRGTAAACVTWASQWLADPVGLTVAIEPPERNGANQTTEVAIDDFGTGSLPCAVLEFTRPRVVGEEDFSIDYRLCFVAPADCLRNAVEVAISKMIEDQARPDACRYSVPVLAIGHQPIAAIGIEAENVADMLFAAYRIGLERGRVGSTRELAAKGGVA